MAAAASSVVPLPRAGAGAADKASGPAEFLGARAPRGNLDAFTSRELASAGHPALPGSKGAAGEAPLPAFAFYTTFILVHIVLLAAAVTGAVSRIEMLAGGRQASSGDPIGVRARGA